MVEKKGNSKFGMNQSPREAPIEEESDQDSFTSDDTLTTEVRGYKGGEPIKNHERRLPKLSLQNDTVSKRITFREESLEEQSE